MLQSVYAGFFQRAWKTNQHEQSWSSDSLGGNINMEIKGYREPINASLEEILERNAQINEIK